MVLSKTAFSKLEYEYFISPKTGLTNETLDQIPGIKFYSEFDNLYSLSKEDLKTLFELKFDLQGTGGRASKQPIKFLVHRRLGPDGTLRTLTPPEIETLLRDHLGLKPKYLQTAGLIKNINRS